MGVSLADAVRSARRAAGLSLRAAKEVAHCSHSYLAEIESGRKVPSPEFLLHLDRALDAGGTISAFADVPVGLRARSHKLVVSAVDPATALTLASRLSAVSAKCDVMHRWTAEAAHPDGDCRVHIWEHGVVVHHVTQERAWPTLTDLALWRYATYPQDREWAGQHISATTQQSTGPADYVLSLYWVNEASWSGTRLDAAIKLVAAPRILVGHPADGRADYGHEKRLLAQGVHLQELADFGVPGASIGWASWSGVVYPPLNETLAIAEDELIDLELQVQALWAYCSRLSSHVQAGYPAPVDPDHGWRWLRAAQLRLTGARPTETGPHRAMRQAVLATSGVSGLLEEAIGLLKES